MRRCNQRLDNQLGEALDLLGEYADVPLQPRTFLSEYPAGAALSHVARQAAALPAEKRFVVWKRWTFPRNNQPAVRVLAVRTTTETTPPAFDSLVPWKRGVAKGAAEHPRPAGEAISTVDLLIEAARDAGRLDDLAVAVNELVAKNCERAEALAALVAIARGAGEEVLPFVRQQIADYPSRMAPARLPLRREDWLLARACRELPDLQDLGEEYLNLLIQHAQQFDYIYWLPTIYHDLYRSRSRRGATAGATPARDPGLQFWHPVSHEAADRRAHGEVTPWWMLHEDLLGFLGGREFDLLYFDYPLTGDFEFTFESLDGRWEEGNACYGGLVFEALHGFMPPWIWPVGLPEWLIQPEVPKRQGEFNAVRLEVRPDRIRCFVNDKLTLETEEPSAASPWLALYLPQSRRGIFRNPRLQGHPRIPRDVRLTDGDHLEGWISRFYGEAPPRRLTAGRPRNSSTAMADTTKPTWTARDGEIQGDMIPNAAGPLRQSRLFYHRPLRNGESIRYEFLYEPNGTEVHPALDRLTFLLDTQGVRLRWMTDTEGVDPWSGLPADNVIDEPERRRGPRPLPLKAGQWNSVRLSLGNSEIALELNDVEIYRRPIEPDNDRLFGFYHNAAATTARVRAIVVSGDWPETLPVDTLENVFAFSEEPRSIAERRARHSAIGEEYFLMSWKNVLGSAAGRPVDKRYALLREWVLPNQDHPTFRLAGGLNPHLCGAADAPVAATAAEKGARDEVEFAAPVLELIAVARQLDKLDELARLIEKSPVETGHDQRCRLALLALIEMTRRDKVASIAALRELRKSAQLPSNAISSWMCWPEFVVAWTALGSPELSQAAHELVQVVLTIDLKEPASADWQALFQSLRERAKAAP